VRVNIDIKRVTVREFGDVLAEKIIMDDLGDVLLVTTELEWEASQRERRPPVSVGFRKEYVCQKSRE